MFSEVEVKHLLGSPVEILKMHRLEIKKIILFDEQ